MNSTLESNFTFFTEQNNITTSATVTTNRYTYLLDISRNFRKFCYLAFFLVGTIGNLLTVVILSFKKNRGTSTALFLLCLAASDTVILLTSYMSEWLTIVLNFNFREVNGALCKIHVFLTYFSLQFSSWILVLVTCERCLSVVNPAKVRLICDRKKGFVGLIVIATFLALLNGHWLVGLTHEYNAYTMTYCAASTPGYVKFLNETWPIIDFCVTFAIPCIILIAGNTIIILKITQASHARSHMVASDKKRNTSSLTITLIILNIVFIISMGPASIFLLTYYLTFESQDDEQITRGTFIFEMVNCLAGLNATVNFILYFLSGSKFREDVKALFCCKYDYLMAVLDPASNKRTRVT